MMKSLSLGASLLVAATAAMPAAAGDYYGSYKDFSYAPAPIWRGFYIGINGGGSWGDSNPVRVDDAVTIGKFERSAAFGGGQVGGNWQVSGTGLVLGVEGDIQGSGIDSKFHATSANGNAFDAQQDVDWFATGRGRIGYASNRTLVYATGGVAFGGVNTHIHIDGKQGPKGPFTNNLSKNDVETGFVYGGGLEYAFSPSWSLKAEYQFVDLGSVGLSNIATDGFRDSTNKIDNSFHTARIGLNYRIRSAYDPLK
jgi:outer membrane immunogenic protein